MTTTEFARRAIIILALALVPILIWRLFGVILIGIGAILIATVLQLGAEPFGRLNLPRPLALLLSGIVIVGIVGMTAYLFGTKMAAELQDVLQRTETAQGSINHALQGTPFGRLALAHFGNATFSIPDLLSKLFSISSAFLEAVVVTVFAGIYLAVQPSLYREGLIILFPWKWRANAAETIDDLARALRLWLLGQLIQMVLIGALSTLAVFLIGLPSPFALGLIAGVAEFIPYLGPIIAAIPALLVAATTSVDAALWTLIAYVAIHQIEGDLIAPLVQRQMVYIPPVVMLLSVAALTYLFGWVVIVFAAPIAVMLFVAVNKLYIRDCLGEEAVLPGEPSDAASE